MFNTFKVDSKSTLQHFFEVNFLAKCTLPKFANRPSNFDYLKLQCHSLEIVNEIGRAGLMAKHFDALSIIDYYLLLLSSVSVQ